MNGKAVKMEDNQFRIVSLLLSTPAKNSRRIGRNSIEKGDFAVMLMIRHSPIIPPVEKDTLVSLIFLLYLCLSSSSRSRNFLNRVYNCGEKEQK